MLSTVHNISPKRPKETSTQHPEIHPSFISKCLIWIKGTSSSELDQPDHFAQALVIQKEKHEFLLRNLYKFELSEDQEQAIIDLLVIKNPALVYDNWGFLSDSKKIRVKSKIPFFEIEKQLQTLQQTPSLEALEAILAKIHQLNKTVGIPEKLFTFYERGKMFGIPYDLSFACSRHEAYSLDYLVEKMANDCQTAQEILQLTSILVKNYFIGTNLLLTKLFHAAIKKFPELKSCVSVHHGALYRDAPFLLPKGAFLIIASKFAEMKKNQSSTTTDIFYANDLTQKINQFYGSDYQKAAFLVCFKGYEDKKVPEHYLPVYIEKIEGKLKILCSDSTGADLNPDFLQAVDSTLFFLKDIPSELYISTSIKQSDLCHCYLFAIHDLLSSLKIAEKGDSIFAHLITDSPPRKAHKYRPESIFVRLPAQMLKLSQSFKRIAPVTHQNIMSNKQNLSLGEYANRHTYVYEGTTEGDMFSTQINHHYAEIASAVAEKASHYFEKILRHILLGDFFSHSI